jgi:hypothetical protein
VKPFDPSKLPPAANDNEIRRRGTFGKPKTSGAANRIFGLLGLATAGYQLGDMAGRWYVGPDGVMGGQIGNYLRGQVGYGSPQAPYIADLPWHFGSSSQIANANDLLSLKAGYPVDFRTMDPDELEKLLKKPWPDGKQMEENARNRTNPKAVPQTETVRVDEEGKEWPCLVGPYDQLRKICPGEAHHIVPDMALRYGNRTDGIRGEGRIPNAPSLGQGMTVCLRNDMHSGLHTSLNTTLGTLGSTFTPAGTAPMNRILRESQRSIDQIVGLPKDCKEKAKVAAEYQMAPLGRQPGRTTLSLPSPAATTVLKRGYY